MTDMTDRWIAESRKICDGATEGPWEPYYGDFGTYVATYVWEYTEDSSWEQNTSVCEVNTIYASEGAAPNATFIAHARTALPKALDALEAALNHLQGYNMELAERVAGYLRDDPEEDWE